VTLVFTWPKASAISTSVEMDAFGLAECVCLLLPPIIYLWKERPMRMDARWILLFGAPVLLWLIHPPRLEAG
jgi:hypothetical protein